MCDAVETLPKEALPKVDINAEAVAVCVSQDHAPAAVRPMVPTEWKAWGSLPTLSLKA